MGVQTLSLTWKIHGGVIQTGEESGRTRGEGFLRPGAFIERIFNAIITYGDDPFLRLYPRCAPFVGSINIPYGGDLNRPIPRNQISIPSRD